MEHNDEEGRWNVWGRADGTQKEERRGAMTHGEKV
jgi:hypothetical protein